MNRARSSKPTKSAFFLRNWLYRLNHPPVLSSRQDITEGVTDPNFKSNCNSI